METKWHHLEESKDEQYIKSIEEQISKSKSYYDNYRQWVKDEQIKLYGLLALYSVKAGEQHKLQAELEAEDEV